MLKIKDSSCLVDSKNGPKIENPLSGIGNIDWNVREHKTIKTKKMSYLV